MAIPKFESMDLQEERLNLPENAPTCALFKLQLNLLQRIFRRDSNMISWHQSPPVTKTDVASEVTVSQAFNSWSPTVPTYQLQVANF